MLYQKTDCILWSGTRVVTHGNTYGHVSRKKQGTVLAHRISYEKEFGTIPKGMVIDHLCRNGLCINPLHLEAVTNKENILRGNGACAINARKTHCGRGHILSVENVWKRKDGRRDCKICDRLRRQV